MTSSPAESQLVEIRVPVAGDAIAEIVFVEWLASPGDSIAKGTPLFTLDLEKSVVDVEAASDGILDSVLVHPDDEVQPRQVIGYLRSST